MELSATLRTTATVNAVLEYVRDLDRYTEWMPLVHRAVSESGSQPAAWSVELRARVGPFARSKRLRMVRTVMDVGPAESATRIVFERRELDGRPHAAWRLEVVVGPVAVSTTSDSSRGSTPVTELTMHLSYDGRFFVSVVETILRQHIDEGRTRLSAMLAG
jgi:hypothetical protein